MTPFGPIATSSTTFYVGLLALPIKAYSKANKLLHRYSRTVHKYLETWGKQLHKALCKQIFESAF